MDAPAIAGSLLGFGLSGDLGDLTFYTTRRGKCVAFPRTKPSKPPSPAQNTQRHRFRLAMAAWWDLTPAQRANYERVVHRLSICMTGINLWIHYCLCFDSGNFATLQSQAGLSLTMPPSY